MSSIRNFLVWGGALAATALWLAWVWYEHDAASPPALTSQAIDPAGGRPVPSFQEGTQARLEPSQEVGFSTRTNVQSEVADGDFDFQRSSDAGITDMHDPTDEISNAGVRSRRNRDAAPDGRPRTVVPHGPPPNARSFEGSDDPDVLAGTDEADVIAGRRGDDTLQGERGDDWLDGEDGDDVLEGGPGDDTLLGGSGDNQLRGGPGSDSIYGGDGHDVLEGGPGGDTLYGGADADIFIYESEDDGGALDRIEDFSPDEGDVLYMMDLLIMGGYSGDGSAASLAGFLRMQGSVLQVDRDGGGDGFVDLVDLGAPYTLEQLVGGGYLRVLP